MTLSQFEQAIWHGRSSDGDVDEPRHHGGEIVASVETEFEFGEVAVHMLVTDGTVSASDGAFDVPEGSVDPLERGRQGGPAARSCDDRLMDAPGFADAGETAQAVTDDGAGGIEIALFQGHDFGTAETLYPAQLQADWLPLRRGFDRSHNRRLAGRTTATLATVPLAAEIGVVHLDPSRQALGGVPLHHHLHEFVLDLPGRGLGNIKPASQSMLELPPLLWVRWYMARNQVHSGTLVAAKIVPAINDVCRRQEAHW